MFDSKEGTTILLSPALASQALSISPRTLWSLTSSGKIRSLKIGRLVRYDRDDLRDFIESQKQSRQDGAR